MYQNFVRFLSLIFALVFFAGCEKGFDNRKERKKPSSEVIKQEKSKKPKIIAFGDSLTVGFGLSEKESYPYLLQQRLNAEGYDYEVINAGISGDTTQGGLERIDWSLDQENVEILILALGGNDLLRGIPPSQTKRNLAQIIERAKSKNIKVLLCGMLAPPTMGREYQRDFNTLFPDLADKYNVAFMPFLLEGVALKKELNQADGIHPNAEGMKVVAENVYQALKPLLSKSNEQAESRMQK
ncbi:MAG: arylesterase [Acidobacteria bacterium]|jgi:acyl-CoA thioesterase-1|nr:MAG: arylesterase [Acidobacteriota bacterium]GIU81405.1 MAG: arylesterase [Pyrinomonadaceae bacterium]